MPWLLICTCFPHYYNYPAVWLWDRDSAVGIAAGYGLDGRMVGVRAPVWAGCSLHVLQIDSGAHSYPMSTGTLSPGLKRPGV
jgi:hypothetical protein